MNHFYASLRSARTDSLSFLLYHMTSQPSIHLKPLTPENWLDFVELFGERGACGNCWCMSFRLPKKEFDQGKLNGMNKSAMYELVHSAEHTGLLAYLNNEPIAWIALSPRSEFKRLAYSRVHKPIDQSHVWSIPCFFISKPYQKIGLSTHLISLTIKYAEQNNIGILEAYPK
ncbi:MAG: GNAT family N-acetyltransferase [Bacteroidia bacterium]